jgi:hypothetical protein
MNNEMVDAPTPPVGVIESLTQGFETVAGKLWLLVLPLLIDLLLWMGPRISFAPAIDTLIDTYYSELWKPVVAINPDMASLWPQFAEMLTGMMGSRAVQYLPVFNLPLIGVPVLLAGREASTLPFALHPTMWEVSSPLAMLGVRMLSLGVGIVLGSLYVGLIAEQVRTGGIEVRRWLRRWPINLLWMALLVVVLPVLLLVIYVPFALLAVGLASFGGVLFAVGGLFALLGQLVTFSIAVFMVFTVHGVFLNERGLFNSLWDSVRVVQWNMSATLLLLLLLVVLGMAMTYVWDLAPTGSWVAILGMGGNAFITTGLIAASFVFFKDRYRYWREMRAVLVAEFQRRGIGRGRQ